MASAQRLSPFRRRTGRSGAGGLGRMLLEIEDGPVALALLNAYA
jgi:hypothetical protein